MSEVSETGQPSRHQRSTGGLIGSMIVLVLVVLGIVVFRGAFRDTPDYQPDDIDYLPLVFGVQQLGHTVAYPPTIPEGWTTKATSDASEPAFDLVFTTADEHTAGVHQGDTPTRELIDTYVGSNAGESGETLTTPLGTWTGWRDTDADHAWTTEIGDESVLVYSSGDPDALRSLVESLTTATLTPADVTASSS